MKFTIVTVVYNNRQYIADAIRSVCEQTYKNIEYIIIDGGSTDGTIDVISHYRDKIDLFVSEPDHGLYDAMNKSILLATGDVIAFLNSDDVYNDINVISTIAQAFNTDCKLDVVYGDLVYVKRSDLTSVKRMWRSKAYNQNYFESGHVPAHPSLFIKRSVFILAGHFNLGFNLAADYEFMLRIFKKHEVRSLYLNQILVRMRLGGATNRSVVNIYRQNAEILNAWKVNDLRVPLCLMPLRFYIRLKQFTT